MSTYNTITKMGLTEIDNISHYTLSSKGNEDVLKVYLKTDDDSVCADSCCFHFERTKPGSAADSLAGSDATLVKAVEELSIITQQSRTEHKARLVNDLDKLEGVMAAKLKELRSGLDSLNT